MKKLIILLMSFLGFMTHWLEASDLGHPEFVLAISSKLVNAIAVLPSISTSERERRMVDGVPVDSCTVVTLTPSLGFTENEGYASVKVHMLGFANTATRGQARPNPGVTVNTSIDFKSEISGVKLLSLNSYGIAQSPIGLSVRTTGRDNGSKVFNQPGLGHNIRRVGINRANISGKVALQIPKRSQEIAAEIHRKVSQKSDIMMNDKIATQWLQFDSKILEPLTRSGIEKSEIGFRTDSRRLYLSSPQSLEEVLDDNGSDLSLFLNEDFLSRFFGAKIAGKKLTESEIVSLIGFSNTSLPETKEDKLFIFFPELNPVSVKIYERQFYFVLRVAKFQKNGDDNPPLHIKVSYSLVRDEEKGLLFKKDEIKIYPPRFEGELEDSKDLSSNERILKIILGKKLKERLAPDYPVSEIVLPLANKKVALDVLNLELGQSEVRVNARLRE